jgi:hypothetical protein
MAFSWSSVLSTAGDFFTTAGKKITGIFENGEPTSPPVVTVPVFKTKSTQSNVPIPGRKPAVVTTSTTATPANGTSFSFADVTDFLTKVGGVAEQGVKTFFTAKSNYQQLQTAQELEKIKLAALTSSAENASPAAQIVLPTVGDWLNNPSEAASRVTPAALSGSGIIQSGISGVALIVGGGVLLWALMKK